MGQKNARKASQANQAGRAKRPPRPGVGGAGGRAAARTSLAAPVRRIGGQLGDQLSAAMGDGALQPALGLAAGTGTGTDPTTGPTPAVGTGESHASRGSAPDAEASAPLPHAPLDTPDVHDMPGVIAPTADWPGGESPTLADRVAVWGRAAVAWVRGLSAETWVWIAIVALAAVLRFWDLGAKPLHHDESMHAFFSLEFARDPASYWYDPLLHGPFQFHAEGLIFAVIIAVSSLFHVATAAGNPWITDATARILPATTGVAIVAMTYGLRRPLGRIGAPVAAFLLAISPAFVYFSRFLREDIYFAAFTYLTVICAVQFAQKRTLRWFIATAVAFVLAYATKEAIYLNVAIWLSFLAVLLTWEAGHWIARAMPSTFSERERAFFGHAGPLLLLGAIGSAVGGLALHQMSVLSNYINAHTAVTDLQVKQLEDNTVSFLLYASIALALFVIAVLVKQIYFDLDPRGQYQASAGGADADYEPAFAVQAAAISPHDHSHVDEHGHDHTHEHDHGAGLVATADTAPAGRAWRAFFTLDAERQPLLALLRGISWVSWFVAFVVAWVVFSLLYWVVPGPDHQVQTIAQGFQVGVGRGIWQGLYYWLQQQQVARGGQPWYYYLLLIPLYEQLAVVFGLAGIVVALRRPTRFRLFLVYWFVASLALYSWAGEKMPWLSIHILLPLELLAAITIAGLIARAVSLARRFRAGELSLPTLAPRTRAHVAGVALGALAAVALLVPSVYGMVTLTYRDPANGPHEMMVYVQTTPDVDLVMSKLNRADQIMYGGKHQLKIAVGQGEEWPFYWYLRDYWLDAHPSQYVYFDYPINGTGAPTEDVLLLTPEDASTFLAAHKDYTSHEYQLRSWWDEGYKPPPCVGTTKNPCPPSAAWGSGVGPAMWLSYGDVYPPHAKFDLGRTATRLWDWLWQRKPLGADNGSYDFVLVVRNGVPIQP